MILPQRTMPWRPGAQLSADCMSAGPDCAARWTGCGSSDIAQAVCCSESGPALSLVSWAVSAALAQILADATCNEGVSARCWAAIIAPAAASTDRKSASAATGHANPSRPPPSGPTRGSTGHQKGYKGLRGDRGDRLPASWPGFAPAGAATCWASVCWGRKAEAKGRKAYLTTSLSLNPNTPCRVPGQETF